MSIPEVIKRFIISRMSQDELKREFEKRSIPDKRYCLYVYTKVEMLLMLTDNNLGKIQSKEEEYRSLLRTVIVDRYPEELYQKGTADFKKTQGYSGQEDYWETFHKNTQDQFRQGGVKGRKRPKRGFEAKARTFEQILEDIKLDDPFENLSACGDE